MAGTQKKLMVLGAGPFQLSGIIKTVASGHEVTTVDYLPENIGHRFSHRYINASTTDERAVLQAARDLEIDGIVTFGSDVATPVVAAVAKKLGLPGADCTAVARLSNKARFRRFQEEEGLHHPRYVVGERLESVWSELSRLRPPLMFKPVDTSGSRGVSSVETLEKSQCTHAFANALKHSTSGMVCIEEFLPGTEVGGDAFLSDGELAFAAITHKHRRGFVVTGHSFPTNIPLEAQVQVLEEIEKTCHAAGYTVGPLNFDVMVQEDRVVILEMSPRTGGNGIPDLIEHATGFDLFTATTQAALGEEVLVHQNEGDPKSSGSWVFGAENTGCLTHLASEDELRRAVPEILAYVPRVEVGEEVSFFNHGGVSLGYVLFDCPAGILYDDVVQRINQALEIRVSQK